MTNDEVAKHLDDAHKAMTAAGEAMGGKSGRYELYTDSGETIPTFDRLAEALRSQRED